MADSTEGVEMKCQVYPFKHQGQTLIMFPCSTSMEYLPKSVRHEIDAGTPWPQLNLNPGKRLGSMDESRALQDITTEGYHIQHLNPGDERAFKAA